MVDVEIDGGYLLQIAGEDSELVISILGDFERDSVKLIEELRDYLKVDLDLGSIGQLLHKFKGSSGSLGMVSLSRAVMEMEGWTSDQWLREGFDLTTLIDHLDKSVELCKKALA